MQKKDTEIVSECNVDCVSTAPQAKILFSTKRIAVLTTFQHQKVEITKNNPEMRIFMGGCDFGLRGGGV